MAIEIRKASFSDAEPLKRLFDAIHDNIEAGKLTTGWKRDGYPLPRHIIDGIKSGRLFVLVRDGHVAGAAIINQEQDPAYKGGNWTRQSPDSKVMVLHMLAVDPQSSGQGLGTAMLRFYAQYALDHGCPDLRLDTNVVNKRAQSFYTRLGFKEAGIVKTEFNGLGEINLVLLESSATDLLRRTSSQAAVPLYS